MSNANETLEAIADLIDGWCERRCLRALREILHAWPTNSGMTDDLAELYAAMERVRAFAKSELTDDELFRLERAIHEIGLLVSR